MDKRLLDYDPETREKVWFVQDDDDPDKWSYEYEQDCEPILEDNKALRSTGNDAWRHGDDFRLEASIPAVILMKWLNEDGIEFWKPEGMQRIVKEKLNDPDWRGLKTFDGRI